MSQAEVRGRVRQRDLGGTHRNLGLPEVLHRQGHAAEHLRQEQRLRGRIEDCVTVERD